MRFQIRFVCGTYEVRRIAGDVEVFLGTGRSVQELLDQIVQRSSSFELEVI